MPFASSALHLLSSLRRPIQQSLVALASPEGQLMVQADPDLLLALSREAALLATRLSELVPRIPRDAEVPLVIAVDDEADTVSAIQELLSPDFEVIGTTSPHEALELVRARRPDAVLTDLRMPEMNGRSLLEVIRGDQSTANIPCLVMSGSADAHDRVDALERGAVDFMAKPLEPGELAARTRNAILRARALRDERVLGETDVLTSLPNRRAFNTFLERSVEHAQRCDEQLCVVMIDQDRLKHLNDTYGHQAGDEGIRALASALSSRKRAGDLVARLGGDEFVLVLPRTDAAGAHAMLSDVATNLESHPFHAAAPLLRVAFSFGVAALGETGLPDTPEQLLERADQALYRAKRMSRRESSAAVCPAPGPTRPSSSRIH